MRHVAPTLLGLPVRVPHPVRAEAAAALGAARQAAWALNGGAVPPSGRGRPRRAVPGADLDPGADRAAGAAVRGQYLGVRDRWHREAARAAPAGAGGHPRR